MSPRKTILAAAAAVMLLGARTFGALLVGDGNAMAGWNGTVNFDMIFGGLTLKAEVDYAVYAPGHFNSSFAGGDPSGGSHYVYAYRVHNTSTVASEKNPAFFSVGLDFGDEPDLTSIGYLDLNNGVDPVASLFKPNPDPNPSSATWDFGSGMPKNSYSEVLLFTSKNGPENESASIQGVIVSTRQLPSPVPEPGTALAACGMAAALLIRRRASK